MTDLEALRATLIQEYWLRIISRPGEQTAVWRVPQRNPNARNYYAARRGDRAGRPRAATAGAERGGRQDDHGRKFGVRVSADVFNQIARDKQDDGIVQRNRLGEKRRGELDVNYAFPVMGGRITQW